MGTKAVPVIPAAVPGFGMAELVKHMILAVKSDLVNHDSDTTVNLFELRGGEVILGVYVNVKEAFEASGTSAAATATIEVPGDSSAVVAWSAAASQLQTISDTGMYPDTLAGPIHVPDSGGVVTFNQEPGTTTTGQVEVYMRYIPGNVSKL